MRIGFAQPERERRGAFCVSAIVVLCLVIGAPAAFAELRICNKTSNTLWIAVGYNSGSEWASAGWWKAVPQGCATVISESLRGRYYYIHAYDDDEPRNYWTGDHVFCTKQEKFTIYGDQSCASRGYSSTKFFQIDTGGRSDWVHELVGSNPSAGLSKQILGKWKSGTETMEFFSDGTIIVLSNGNYIAGNYRFVDPGRMRLEFSGLWALLGVVVADVSIEGDTLWLKLPGQSADVYRRMR